MPHQASVSESGKPASIDVCVSFSDGSRSRPSCSRGRRLGPSCAVTSAADPTIRSTCPPSTSFMAGPPPRYGTWIDFHAGLLGEHRHGEMAERTDADRGVLDRAGLGFRRRNDVGKGLERPAGVGREHIGGGADQKHRHQILLDVELRIFENGGNHRVRIEGHQKRRAIRRALGDLGGAERTGRAGLVLDQHGTAELGLQMGLQQPGHRVGGTSRRKRHHQRHDLACWASAGVTAKAADAASMVRLVIFRISLPPGLLLRLVLVVAQI